MALKKQVLIVSQVIPQWYVDVLTDALGEGVHIDILAAMSGGMLLNLQSMKRTV